MTKKSCLILFLFGCIAYGQNLPLRIAWWNLVDDTHPDPLPNDFLIRAKAANYNYIAVNFPLPNPRIGHHLRSGPEWRARITQLFIQANNYGLRLIPGIEMSSKWDRSWTDLTNDYPDIQLNIEVYNTESYFTTSLSPDPVTKVVTNSGGGQSTVQFMGVDIAFGDIMADFKEAYFASRVKYPLEYIYLGHDEPVIWDYLLIGNSQNNGTWTNPQSNKTYGPFSSNDQAFLNGHGGLSTSSAYQQLFGSEILRRVNKVQGVFGTSFPKILISADMWDPQANGGLSKSTNAGSIQLVDPIRVKSGDYTQGLAALPGLLPEDAAKVRSNVILAPWNYDKAWRFSSDPDGNGKYDAKATYGYLTANAFNFVVFGSSDSKTDRSRESIAEGNATIQQCALDARDYLKTSSGASYMGYIAGIWPPASDATFGRPVWNEAQQNYQPPFWDNSKSMYNQLTSFQTLEYMNNVRVITPVISGILLGK